MQTNQVAPLTNRTDANPAVNKHQIRRGDSSVTKAPIIPLLLRRLEVAALINIAGRTLDRMIASGQFPIADIAINSKLVRWKRETVEAWVASGGQMLEGVQQ